ncbi:hypothetical protein ACEPAG_3281 [Sanghuangporus baumii]
MWIFNPCTSFVSRQTQVELVLLSFFAYSLVSSTFLRWWSRLLKLLDMDYFNEGIDLSTHTPSLTRSSSTDSQMEPSRECEIEALISHIDIRDSDQTDNCLVRTFDGSESQEDSHAFIDERGSFMLEKPQVIDEIGSPVLFVSSPAVAEFTWLSGDVQSDEPEDHSETSLVVFDEPENIIPLRSSPEAVELVWLGGDVQSDEPEDYSGDTQVAFGEPGNIVPLVSSPKAAKFSWSGSDVKCEEPECLSSFETQTQVLCGEPANGLVSSPTSEAFSIGDDTSLRSPQNETSTKAHIPMGRGRRKALLIGIKYYRPQYYKNTRITSLKGPHHDVREVQRLLQGVYGWDPECFRILKDDNGPRENQPTLKNIRHEIKELVKDAQPGDNLFFYFSGHGSQVEDQDDDEDDGKDEVLVSCDGQLLVDDELHEILVKPIPEGCHLTAVLDCCSSGTGLGACFFYFFAEVLGLDRHGSVDLPYSALQAEKDACDSTERVPGRPVRRKHSKGNVVLLSACADAEHAAEKIDLEDEHGRVRGMLTKAFIDSLKTRRKSTYDELMTSVRTQLRRKDTMQDPQLSSSRMIDMNDYIDL